MSGVGIMEVREGCAVAGCSEIESALCHEFSACFVRRAAGVIAGFKPAALFNFVPHIACSDPCTDELWCGKVAEVIGAYADELPRYGVELVVLHVSRRRVALLAYRPSLVGAMLHETAKRAFLEDAEYATESVQALVHSLQARMRAYYQAAERGDRRPGYPHEVGLLLGYPLEDVRGFMAGRRETCRGPWKAYGDERAARERFGRIALREGRCQARYRQGLAFGELFGADEASKVW